MKVKTLNVPTGNVAEALTLKALDAVFASSDAETKSHFTFNILAKGINAHLAEQKATVTLTVGKVTKTVKAIPLPNAMVPSKRRKGGEETPPTAEEEAEAAKLLGL